MIAMGDLNVDPEKAGGQGWDEEIAAAVVTAGLEDLARHFLLRQRAWSKDWKTWAVVRQGMVVRSWTDYILGSYCRIFQNIATWDSRHNSDRFMVVGCLCGASPG